MEGSLVAYKVFTNASTLQASEVNENLMRQSVMVFSNAAARTAAITSPVEGMTTYLEDSNLLQTYNSSSWVTVANAGAASFNLVNFVYFTANGTFSKASYPWLRAMVVTCVGAGGGGGNGGAASNGGGWASSGAGGGGGGFSKKFITDIASLPSSITVTVGSGGAAGTAGGNGSTGGSTSFSTVIGNGGAGGAGMSQQNTSWSSSGGNGGTGSGSDITINGESGRNAAILPTLNYLAPGSGGASFYSTTQGLASPTVSGAINLGGSNGNLYGGGGSGSASTNSSGATFAGNGAQGVVILELYA
jgi:hypothetical protein